MGVVVAQDEILPTPTPIPVPAVVIHIVRSGETLNGIARQYGVNANDLIALNGIGDPSLVIIGQSLIIPAQTSVETPTPRPTLIFDSPPITPTVTQSPTPTPTRTPDNPNFDAGIIDVPIPPMPDMPESINDVPIESIIVLPDAVRRNVRAIYLNGQAQGRNPRAFSKIGDSVIENPHFLTRFDSPLDTYNLGNYDYLQAGIDHYRGSHGRQGVAVRRGMHAWTVVDPLWADPAQCEPNETVIACEFRLHNPSVVFIRLGSNDRGALESFTSGMAQIVEFSIVSGVIPVLITKADRREGNNINNEMMRRIASEYSVPLIDFDLVSATLPGRGLDQDGIHLKSFFAHDYTSPIALQRGHGVHNLMALMMLDAIWRIATDGA
jgi:hypothetical protein